MLSTRDPRAAHTRAHVMRSIAIGRGGNFAPRNVTDRWSMLNRGQIGSVLYGYGSNVGQNNAVNDAREGVYPALKFRMKGFAALAEGATLQSYQTKTFGEYCCSKDRNTGVMGMCVLQSTITWFSLQESLHKRIPVHENSRAQIDRHTRVYSFDSFLCGAVAPLKQRPTTIPPTLSQLLRLCVPWVSATLLATWMPARAEHRTQ